MADTGECRLAEAKKRCRRLAMERRAAAAAQAPEAGAALSARLRKAVALPAGAVVSAFWPLEGEIDTRPLMRDLVSRGHVVVLPVMQGAGRPLLFRAWAPGDSLVAAEFGTREPQPDRPALVPEVLLVPLLAFDRRGYRLGYGGGFYDRTLQELRARGPRLCIGIAYAGQELPEVPHDGNDQRLDWVVTEREAIEIAAAPAGVSGRAGLS